MENRFRSMVIRFRQLSPVRRRLLLAGSFLGGALLFFLLSSNKDGRAPHPPVPISPDRGSLNSEFLGPDGAHSLAVDGKQSIAVMPPRPQSELYKASAVDSAGLLREPRVAYSAELSVVTKEFARSRSSLEEILERHRGYVAKLRMVGQPSASVLSATLRVPSTEYRSTLAELKGVGLVEHEEESADEITQQHSEIEARLVNAQNEERRLVQLLQNRSEKTIDPSTVERQVSMLRGEIDRIQAELYSFGSRVSFCNVLFALREEHTLAAETIGAKLRNSAVSGLSDAFESVSTILLFLAGRGPLLVLWLALLYFPARFLWRKSQWVFRDVESPKIQ